MKPCPNVKSITTTTVHTSSSDFRFQVIMSWRDTMEPVSKCFVAHDLPFLPYHKCLSISQPLHSCQIRYVVLSYETNICQEAGSNIFLFLYRNVLLFFSLFFFVFSSHLRLKPLKIKSLKPKGTRFSFNHYENNIKKCYFIVFLLFVSFFSYIH